MKDSFQEVHLLLIDLNILYMDLEIYQVEELKISYDLKKKIIKILVRIIPNIETVFFKFIYFDCLIFFLNQ